MTADAVLRRPASRIERPAMDLAAAFAVLNDVRRDQVVLTTMSSSRVWPRVSQHPLDFHHVPAAMAHTPALALGIALAQPQREIIVLNGDGSLLMSLGILVTIARSGARNYTLVNVENGVYEVTGCQRTPGEQALDFAGMAAAAGFAVSRRFDDLAAWKDAAPELLAAPGPRFVSLVTEPDFEDFRLPVPPGMPERTRAFRSLLTGQ